MKIASINEAATSDAKNIGFNVTGKLDSTVLSRMRLEGLWIGISGQALIVESQEPLTPADLDRISSRYAEVEAQIAQEVQAEDAKRQALLASIAASINLPLEAA